VIRLDLWRLPFYIEWDPDDPEEWQEGQDLDFPEILAHGPFVMVVHDEAVWAGQHPDSLYNVAARRSDPPNFQRWKALADIYADCMGVSRQGLLLRYWAMKRYLAVGDRKGEFHPWGDVYHWPEGGEFVWSALVRGNHPWLKVREHEGQRQVKYE